MYAANVSFTASTEHADYTYGAAVHKLRDLLDLQEPDHVGSAHSVVDFNLNHSNSNYAHVSTTFFLI